MKQLLLVAILLLTACGQQVPKPECDPAEFTTRVLGCDQAVAAAITALPADHPAITRIQFLYGSVSPGRGLLLYPQGDQPIYGYVVFTWADGSRRQYVDLTVYHDALTVGAPTPY